MRPSFTSLNKLALLVTSMLIAPAFALAQTPDAEPAPVEDAAQPAQDEADPFADMPEEEGEIVVLGRFIPEPMRETSEVATFLSTEDLARQGDDNAAAALTRLTGLSVVSGRFVYVRGLGDRYSSALLNGSPLPSPEPLRRQVPLDLFPSNILDGATVQKTFSPNYPGEFGGGIIDLRTLRIPGEQFATLKVGTAYNSESTTQRGLLYYGDDTDWTGYDTGLRDIPGPLAAAIAQGQRINDSNFSADALEAIGESFVNSPLTVVQSETVDPDFEGEVTAGTLFDRESYRIGLIGVVGYDTQRRTQEARRVSVVGDTIDSDLNTLSTAQDIVFNAFGSASLEWGAQDNVTLSGLLVRSTTKDTEIAQGSDVDVPNADVYTEATAWYERQLASIQLSGDHTFGNFDFDWRGAFAQSTRDAPYERSVRYEVVNNEFRYNPGASDANSTRFSELTDEVVSGGLDGSYTLALSETRDAVFSAGYAYSNTIRDYGLLSFAFRNQISQIPDDVLLARPDFLFSPDNIDPFRFELEEITGRDDAYKGRLTVNAAYAAADVEIIPLLRAAIGVRYEDATQIVRTGNRFGEVPFAPVVTREEEYFLPAGTLTWNFAEDLQLRIGYSQTIARPQFRELAFTPYLDPETDRIYTGNPFLTDSEFQNYDARLEYYFGRNQFVTVGAFYKQIDNPIEEVLVPLARLVTNFINAPEATLTGAEIEYRTTFELPNMGFMDGATWLFAANYTYTSSEVTAGDELVVNPTVLPSFALIPASQLIQDGSELQGTPEHIANIQFGYETDTSQLTLLVGYVSERISRRGLGALPTVYEDPGTNIDLVYRRNFTLASGAEVTLGLSGRNLLDEDYLEYQNSTLGQTDFNTYARGRTFSISLTGKF
ncbi:MAG: TonB-dependent receptor plug domain-containing protein [Alphaproteobacteria bacterium]|nr:TonB-dependent receptor plug domain-containing protein [Alphaproteobacteria bacterium]